MRKRRNNVILTTDSEIELKNATIDLKCLRCQIENDKLGFVLFKLI